MPGYIKKLLTWRLHESPPKPQNAPYPILPRKYDRAAKEQTPPDNSSLLDPEGIKQIHQIVGGMFYYVHAVDATFLVALSTLASNQTTAMKNTNRNVK